MQKQAVGPRARANITLEILHKTRANMRVVKDRRDSWIVRIRPSGLPFPTAWDDALYLYTECYCLCLLSYPIHM